MSTEKFTIMREIRSRFGCDLREANDFYLENPANWRERMEAKMASGTTYTSPLEKVRAVVNRYYAALDRREHAGIAQDKAFAEIQEVLGMSWTQGATLPKPAEVKGDGLGGSATWDVGDGYRFVLLETKDEYKAEGAAMKSAVLHWWKKPDSRILSLRHADEDHAPLLTMEVRPSTRQVWVTRGYCNEKVTPFYAEVVKRWCAMTGYTPLEDGLSERGAYNVYAVTSHPQHYEPLTHEVVEPKD